MNSFWQAIYDDAKDRRNGILFFATFLGLVGLFVGSLVIIGWIGWENYLQPFLLGGVVLFLAFIWRLIRRARKWKPPETFSELSRDELSKARSKLRSQPAMKKLPDIDLKY